jgi:hypothetical protein
MREGYLFFVLSKRIPGIRIFTLPAILEIQNLPSSRAGAHGDRS